MLSSKGTTCKETGIGAAHQHRPNKESYCSQQDLQQTQQSSAFAFTFELATDAQRELTRLA